MFDGVCNLCNGVVKLVIRQDKKAHFKLAALQSLEGRAILKTYKLPQKDFETFLLIEEGKVYQKSTAALKVAKHFSWYWQWLQAFWLVPTPIRDAAYRFIAIRRYQWFGKREVCMIPDANTKSRFL